MPFVTERTFAGIHLKMERSADGFVIRGDGRYLATVRYNKEDNRSWSCCSCSFKTNKDKLVIMRHVALDHTASAVPYDRLSAALTLLKLAGDHADPTVDEACPELRQHRTGKRPSIAYASVTAEMRDAAVQVPGWYS